MGTHRHAAHEAWKQGVLAGDIVLPEIETAPYDPPVVRTPVGELRVRR